MTTITHGDKQTIHLPAQHVLTVIASVGGSGSITRLGDRSGEPPQHIRQIAAAQTIMVGPFNVATSHEIACADWSLTYGIALADFAVTGTSIPAVDLPAGFVELFGDGAPVAPVKATLETDLAGDNNDLVFTANVFGEAGNGISVEYREQETALAPLSVEVSGKAIVIHLEMDDSEPPQAASTAGDIETAIGEHDEAAALVTVENASDNNGTGVVIALAKTFLGDGAGTGVGVAGPGSRYSDIGGDTGPALYINTGDDAEPEWTQLGQEA